MSIGTRSKKGFTLIELLIVIAIIAILAAVVFVALDPLNRFRDARDSARWTDVTALLSATRVSQVDKGGKYIYAISHLPAVASATGSPMLIVNATTTTGCNAVAACDAAPTEPDSCINMSQLVDRGYLGKLPVSANGAGNWSLAGFTGYYMTLNANNSVTIGACESENTNAISVTR